MNRAAAHLAAVVRALRESDPPPTAAALGRRLKLQRSRAANLIRVARLPRRVVELMLEGSLAAKAGEELLRLRAQPLRIIELAERAARERWRVDRVAHEVNLILGRVRTRAPAQGTAAVPSFDSESPDPNIAAVEVELAAALGQRVRISTTPQGDGCVAIRFHSLDEFDGLLERLLR